MMRFLLLLMLVKMSTCGPEKKTSVVLMGDSITSEWFRLHPEFFEGKPYINKGISGETTAQMVSRFQTDVIDLKPTAVVILAGTNDIAQNQGPVPIETTFDNIRSMSEAARKAGIKVILSSVLPAYDYPWKPGLRPYEKIPVLNAMIADYAKKEELSYIDYFAVMKDERNGLKQELGRDGVHPVVAGYLVMEPLLEAAVKATLK